MGIEQITGFRQLSIDSGDSCRVTYVLDGEEVHHGEGSVAEDVGMFFDGEGDVHDNRKVYALTHPVGVNISDRYGRHAGIYLENRVEINDARLAPPRGTIGYDIEVRSADGGMVMLVITLADKMANYAWMDKMKEQIPAREQAPVQSYLQAA